MGTSTARRTASDVTDIDLVLSGSGTLAPAHLGAAMRLVALGMRPVRVAGTSGGAIVAAALAFGMDHKRALKIAVDVLDGELLDPVPWWKPWEAVTRFGVYRFDRIRERIAREFPGTMGNSSMPWGVFVVDLETRSPVFISSMDHPEVSVADAVTASASIPVFAQARRIGGLRGLFVDGGAAVNFGMGVWDDTPERPTVGVRFGSSGPSVRQPVENPVEYAHALARVFIKNANKTHISTKRYADVIRIRTAGSGLDFSMTQEQVCLLLADGARAVDRWVERRGGLPLSDP